MQTTKATTPFREIYNALPSRGHGPTKRKWLSELASLCCISEGTIRNWLYGTETPNRHHIETMAHHLGVNPDYLFLTQSIR